ncbi:helix-turn-helix transcriptional regulator [bacterium]|nr:helix-turn-helix transcriptional regulator [bacterium]
MRDALAITKALADESRLRALCALRGRELCVCQIIELLGLAPSTVSKHMSILHQARLVDSRKKGRWVYYRLAGPRAASQVREAVRWVLRALKQDEQTREDDARLAAILEIAPEELCRK